MPKDLPTEFDPVNTRTLDLRYASVLSDRDHPEGLKSLILAPSLDHQEKYDVELYQFRASRTQLLELARDIREKFDPSETPESD